MEIRKIQKSGNSWYITIPKRYILILGLKVKDYITIKWRGTYLELTPSFTPEREKCKPKKKKSKISL